MAIGTVGRDALVDDTHLHQPACRGSQLGGLVRRDRSHRAPWIDSAEKERLALVDVADSGHDALIHQRVANGADGVHAGQPPNHGSGRVHLVGQEIRTEFRHARDGHARFQKLQRRSAVLSHDGLRGLQE
jgi:hypothetical protein